MTRLHYACFIALLVTGAMGEAQSPPHSDDSRPLQQPEPLTLQPHPELGKSRDPIMTQGKIENALQGDETSRDSDPVLDEVLQIIRRKGSVLDGSVLDTAPASVLSVQSELVSDERAHAAESLLRTARLLTRLSPQDDAQRELIARMRLEAAKLLRP